MSGKSKLNNTGFIILCASTTMVSVTYSEFVDNMANDLINLDGAMNQVCIAASVVTDTHTHSQNDYCNPGRACAKA